LLDNSMAEMADSADDDIAARSSTFAFVRHWNIVNTHFS